MIEYIDENIKISQCEDECRHICFVDIKDKTKIHIPYNEELMTKEELKEYGYEILNELIPIIK